MTIVRQPTRAGVRDAAAKIAAILPQTPLLTAEIRGVPVCFKAENLQPIGAFKIRGAWHRISELGEAERARGVVGVSSGNHAQGVAWAARKLGIRATIVMPSNAPAVKLERTRALGAEVVHAEADYTDRGAEAATGRLLEGETPIAFVYSSDLMAVGGNAVLRDRRTPAAVVSWDDSVLCRTAVPSITALQRDSYGSGRRSAEILLDRVAGVPDRRSEWKGTPLAVRASSIRPA